MSGERRDVTVGGVRLACHLGGAPDARPLVLLHALGESSASWDVVAGALGREHRLVAVDLRGHGASDWPGDYGYPALRDDVVGVLDALGLARADVLGHSLGGAVALLVAQTAPDRVARLVLEDVGPLRRRARPRPARPDGPLPFDWAALDAVHDEFADPDPGWWARLPAISAPTLIVAGGAESTIPQAELAEAAALIRDCRLVTIQAGHYVHDADPAAFTAAVLGFLAPCAADGDASAAADASAR